MLVIEYRIKAKMSRRNEHVYENSIHSNRLSHPWLQVEVVCGAYGEHGFGLKRFWAKPCRAWCEALLEEGGRGPVQGPDPAQRKADAVDSQRS